MHTPSKSSVAKLPNFLFLSATSSHFLFFPGTENEELDAEAQRTVRCHAHNFQQIESSTPPKNISYNDLDDAGCCH